MTPVARRDDNPYLGPHPFEREDAKLFFGRDREIRRLFYQLIAERILLLHSPSGAGKTSLIQAGLIPILEKEEPEFQVLRIMRVGEVPDPRDLEGIFVRNRYVLSALQSLEEALPKEERTPLGCLAAMEFGAYLDQRWSPSDGQPNQILIFDQFEELLTASPVDNADKAEFFRQVGAALRDPWRWALFAMREDFLAGLSPYLLPVPGRLQTRFRLDLLEEPAARDAIQKPAQAQDVTFWNDAVDELIEELSKVRVQALDGTPAWKKGPYVEPILLQVTCLRLWKLKGSRREITADLVKSIGNVDEALAAYYSEQTAATATRTGVPERAIREWFDRHLITARGIRGQVLQEVKRSQGLDNRAIDQLVDAYLVRREQRRGATWYELAHDRLIEPLRRDNETWYRTQEGTSITVRIHDWDRRSQTHRAEATLDDGRFFYGGELHLDEEALGSVEHDCQAYGTLLFDTLFGGPLHPAYEAAIQRAAEGTRGRLRFRLWIDSESLDMHVLPWERLYHLEQGHPVPMSTSSLVSFSRYKGLPSVEPSPISERPLRLLIAISNPANLRDFGLPTIDVEQELANYDAALGDLQKEGLIQVTLMPGISGLTPEFHAKLRGKGYHIQPGITQLNELLRLLPNYHALHFHGYGSAGGLLTERADGTGDLAAEDDLILRLAAISLPRLVVLGGPSMIIPDDPMAKMVGLAPKLIGAGVPAVLTFHRQMILKAAKNLLEKFYSQLCERGTVDEALNHARARIRAQGPEQWAQPVLFTSFSRYKGLPSVESSPISERPLRLLIAISNPANLRDFGLPTIDVEQELANYDAALGDLQKEGLVQVTLMPGITLKPANNKKDNEDNEKPGIVNKLKSKGYRFERGITQLHELLRLLPNYHAFHFHGYGGVNQDGEGFLCFEGSDGRVKIVTEDGLISRLAAIPLPRLVVLGGPSMIVPDDPRVKMVNLAPKLIQAGVPAVLSFHEQMTSKAAGELLEKFYSQLCERGTVDEALNRARAKLCALGWEWWSCPVLFTSLERAEILSTHLAPSDGGVPRHEEHRELVVRIRPRDQERALYPVEARLDDGGVFYGGGLSLSDLVNGLGGDPQLRDLVLGSEKPDLKPVQERLYQWFEVSPQDAGLWLFEVLFSGPTRRAYEKGVDRADTQTQGRLRFRLWIDGNAAELHDLPWEVLHGIRGLQPVPLAASPLTPFSRYVALESAERKPIATRPLRLLIAISNPTNERWIDSEWLASRLLPTFETAQDKDLVLVTLMPGTSGLPSALQKKLEKRNYEIQPGATELHEVLRFLPDYHIFQFFGPSRKDKDDGTEALVFEGWDGRSHLIPEADLEDLWPSDAMPLPQMVVLSTTDTTVNLATRLARRQGTALVASQGRMPVLDLLPFTLEFYLHLFEHGLVDRAVNQARLAIFDTNRPYWTFPVLLMGLPHGQLFHPPSPGEENES